MQSIVSAINKAFCFKCDENISGVNQTTVDYINSRLLCSNLDVTNLSATLERTANIMTLEISGVISGNLKSGKIEWPMMELLTIDVPITRLIDDFIAKVFEFSKPVDNNDPSNP